MKKKNREKKKPSIFRKEWKMFQDSKSFQTEKENMKIWKREEKHEKEKKNKDMKEKGLPNIEVFRKEYMGVIRQYVYEKVGGWAPGGGVQVQQDPQMMGRYVHD